MDGGGFETVEAILAPGPWPVPPVVSPVLLATADTVTAAHDGGPYAALRLAATLAAVTLEYATLADLGELTAIDAAAAARAAWDGTDRDPCPLPASSPVLLFRRRGAALLTGRHRPPAGRPCGACTGAPGLGWPPEPPP